MRRDGASQPDLIVSWAEVPRSPGHALYDKLQKVLVDQLGCRMEYRNGLGACALDLRLIRAR